MKKVCVICGAPFDAPPSAKRVTCGTDVCIRANKARTHQGKQYPWSGASRQRLAARGRTDKQRHQQRVATVAAQQSPLAGPFETNQEAKLWWLISPEGERYHVRNLRKFCRDHADLFAPDEWQKASAGIRQIQAWLMGKRPRMVSQWKGWTLSQPAVSPAQTADDE